MQSLRVAVIVTVLVGGTALCAPLTLAQATSVQDCICTGVATGVKYDSDLVHVICIGSDTSCAIDGIRFFAVRGATSRAATQALGIALTARASNKALYLRYRVAPDTVPGCDAATCRELVWIGDWN